MSSPSDIIIHQDIRQQVLENVKKALDQDSFEDLLVMCRNWIDKAADGLEADIKTAVDTGLRDVLYEYITSHRDDDNDHHWYELIIELSIKAVRHGICNGNLPIILLTDLFDCKQLSECEKLFSLLESRVNIWKEDVFFNNVKNQMLRSCNDLLRRLSRSQHTVFGGRILEFLARFFPLFERSGLNLTSEFNQENIVSISAQEDLPDSAVIGDSALEEGEMLSTDTVQVDYNLYRKFWRIQTYFRDPNMCYAKIHWKQFQSYSTDVLAAFSTYKLDPLNLSNLKGLEKLDGKEEQIHFTKYLTNQKLLELQLSDSNFRRYILVQFLILFQYLTTYVKGKQESQTLTEDQSGWLKQNTERVLDLIVETPPNGEEMRRCVEHILKREEFWGNWKNEGCPSLKEINEPASKPPSTRKRVGDEIREAEACGRIVIGNSELTQLWNLCPDNWEACLSKKRIFTPPVGKYFEGVVSTYDTYTPEERQKMISEDSDFSWRALRLLSAKSPYFFTPSNQSMVKPINQYLDTVIEKVVKELTADGSKGSQELAIDDTEDISNDELLKQVDENSNLGPPETISNDKKNDQIST